HRLIQAWIRNAAAEVEIVQTPEYVVVPVNGEGEGQPVRIDHFPSTRPAAKTTNQQILLGSSTSFRHRDCPARPLVLQQPLKYADRGVERRPHRSVLGFTVPPAVIELFAEQTLHQAIHGLSEIGSDGHSGTVDARLGLAIEERLAAVFPAGGSPGTVDGVLDGCLARVDAEVAEQPQRGHRRRPGLPLWVAGDTFGR